MKKCRVQVQFDVEIDGAIDCSLEVLGDVLSRHLIEGGSVILSENHDQGDEWAVCINSVRALSVESL